MEKVPPTPTDDQINNAWDPVDALQEKIHSLPKTTEQRVTYDWEVGPLIDKKIEQLDQDVADARKVRGKQAERITQALSLFQEKIEKRISADGGDANKVNLQLWMALSGFHARADIMIP